MHDQGFGGRVGTFLIVLGVFSTLLFVASDFSNQALLPLFCGGALLLGLGAFLRLRNSREQENKPSGRFSILHRGGQGGKSSEDKKG